MTTKTRQPPYLDFDPSTRRLRLDPQSWETHWDEAPVAVTVTEFQLLLLLASLPSKVFSRDAIIDRLRAGVDATAGAAR